MESSRTPGVRPLTHQDETGRPVMVDVGAKPESARSAVAAGALRMAPATLAALRAGRTPKGDALAVAQIAGIQGAKRTAELIPLCHTLPLSHVDVRFELDPELPGVRAEATTRVHGRTGVE
ncbi:MAG TPA: cyclic pyranopterin monophosphate synthase MoaC, partial [Longimicrobiales bacterium]|nr:cyclic pyranopterin monophosphate synthase MoaC [Longimicrobiales bacterium]